MLKHPGPDDRPAMQHEAAGDSPEDRCQHGLADAAQTVHGLNYLRLVSGSQER
jgi:hypothetical protein